MVIHQMEVDGYRRREGEGIHRNWISGAIIGISLTKVQIVFQKGVWLCYKCSRLVSGSAINVPDRCLACFRQHFRFIFSIPSEMCLLEFFCRILS